jgi:hypothetical protein
LSIVDGIANPQFRFQLQEVTATVKIFSIPKAAVKRFLARTSYL